MNLGTLIVVIVIGIAAGALSGLVGIGGGIVIVPLLVMFLGFSQQTAQGTTLAMLSFPVSFVGAYTYWQKGMVDWKIAILLCLGFVAGAKSQLTVTGTVYDSTKTIPIKDVTVKSSSGTFAITDSAGRYTIVTSDRDSLTFIYQGKPTAKFSVSRFQILAVLIFRFM